MRIYKLTDQDMCTHGGYQWALGEWRETNGDGFLCGPGWLHAYVHPRLAVLMNPIYGKVSEPRLFVGEGAGQSRDNRGLKIGFTRMRLDREIGVPVIGVEKRTALAIFAAWGVERNMGWRRWARGWLSGRDRSAHAANVRGCAAAYATGAAAHAAHARVYADGAPYDAYAAAAAAHAVHAAVHAAVYVTYAAGHAGACPSHWADVAQRWAAWERGVR